MASNVSWSEDCDVVEINVQPLCACPIAFFNTPCLVNRHVASTSKSDGCAVVLELDNPDPELELDFVDFEVELFFLDDFEL